MSAMTSSTFYKRFVQSKAVLIFCFWVICIIVYSQFFTKITSTNHQSSNSTKSSKTWTFQDRHLDYQEKGQRLSCKSPMKGFDENDNIDFSEASKEPSNFRERMKIKYKTFTANFGKDNLGNGDKYLIYRCDSNRMSGCGGWADRIKGILLGYVIANLTGRTFKAEMKTHNCEMTDYVIPNHVNWSLPRSFHEEIINSEDVQILNLVDRRPFYNDLHKINFKTYINIKSKFIYLKANLDYMDGLKANTFHAHQLSWMTNLTRDQIAGNIFKRLFQLSPDIQKRLDDLLEKYLHNSSEKLICAHIRMGRNPSIPRDSVARNSPSVFPKVWNFIRTTVSGYERAKVFVMSDSQNAIEDAKNQSFSDRLILVPGEITHTERSVGVEDKTVCKGMAKVLLEQFLLMSCDVLMISKSGLGRMAAYVRGSDEGLFCLVAGEVVPCQMSNLKELYKILG